MRPLTSVETDLVRWFADRLNESRRQRLLTDLENATADDEDFPIVQFHIAGYTRPGNTLERPIPIDAVVRDADGATALVELLEDDNARLYKLEVHRCAPGDLIGPDWTTLRELGPGEVSNLGVTDLRRARMWRWPDTGKDGDRKRAQRG
jgi:hypothetical protein